MAIVEDRRKISVRLTVLQYGITVMFSVLAVGFWVLQVVQHAKYAEIAENNHQRTLGLRAPRGLVFDRDGRVLVENRVALAVKISPKAITQRERGVGSLQESFDAVLVRGACFPCFDNLRGTIAIAGVESFMTEPAYFARIPYAAPGLVGPEKAARGKTPTDVWWQTIVPTNGRERTGYATQKPLAILSRIIAVHSRPGDLVLDFFAGSGTTGEAAARLGRDFILVDRSPEAVRTMRKRLAFAEPKTLTSRQFVGAWSPVLACDP